MRIVARYSFKDGDRVVREKYPELLKEVEEILALIDPAKHRESEGR